MQRLRPTKKMLAAALGISALVASFGVALAATVQVSREIPATANLLEAQVIADENLRPYRLASNAK